MHDLNDIRAWVHAHRDFGECIVESLVLSEFGTTLKIRIDYIWNPDGTVRPDSDDRLFVELILTKVQEITIHNRLNAAMLADMSALSWGVAEVSRVQVLDDEHSERYSTEGTRFHHLVIRRESGPWIDAVFAELYGNESLERPPVDPR